MADNNYVPQVDYTSRDFRSIRDDLTTLIPFFAPQWTNRDPADFGMTLIELFAYMGDQLNYYIDRSANEAFITTASQRNSVLRLARLLGYIPTEATASTAYVTFSNSSASPITVPAYTQLATTVVSNGQTTQILFELLSPVTVPAKTGGVNGSVSAYVTQGESKGYGFDVDGDNGKIGVSDGTANQVFKIPNSPIIGGSITVTISNVVYTYAPFLIDYQGYDPVFSTTTDADGFTYVFFGDNVSGRIPNNGADVYATYRVGGGAIGNVAVNSIKYITKWGTPGEQIPAGLSVINQNVGQTSGAGSGGADPESTDSIRINAPKSIRALSRAVSLSDYSSLAIQVPGVAKANAVADVYSSVTIYLAPYGDSGVQSDGVTSSTVFNNLAVTVGNYFADKTPPGTTLTLQPPTYVDVRVKLSCTILPQYRNAQVTSAITAAITELFAFDNVSFNDSISIQDVYKVIADVPGVAKTSIVKLTRRDQDKVWVVTNKALTSNVATLTTSLTHNLLVGETILVSNVDSTFNGTYVVTAVTTNTFSYACVATNVTSAAVTPNGAVTVLAVRDISCTTYELPQLEQTKTNGAVVITGIDLTTSGGIS